MKKLLLLGALLCGLCSCGQGDKGNGNIHEGHEWVDLGLPSGLKWATCNVEAACPEESGRYYAWGEIRAKSNYDEYNSESVGKSLNNIAGDINYDVARGRWGGNWRLPTVEEFNELCFNCICVSGVQHGQYGYKFTSMKNGNSIFLPASGYRQGYGAHADGTHGFYWSSTPDRKNADLAYVLEVKVESMGTNSKSRYHGCSIRPVFED